MDNLKVAVVSDKDCAVTLSVEIPLTTVKSETKKVFDEIQKNALVPGFRAGKAPLDMIKKNFIANCTNHIPNDNCH